MTTKIRQQKTQKLNSIEISKTLRNKMVEAISKTYKQARINGWINQKQLRLLLSEIELLCDKNKSKKETDEKKSFYLNLINRSIWSSH